MNIFILMFSFLIGGIIGWIYEVVFYYFNSNRKQIYMRGSNFLPFINIYSIGSVLLLLITYRFRKNILMVFLLSVIITGLIELLTGYILDKCFHIRLWDYNKEILNFGNIGGFVCLRSVLIFGFGGLFLVYVLIPLYLFLSGKVLEIVTIILFSIFIIDLLYNMFFYKIFNNPNARLFYESKGLKYLDF